MRKLLTNFNGKPPATRSAISAAQKSLGEMLPRDYVAFLNISNGGEGLVGESQYVILWRVQELAKMNRAYEVEQYAPGLLVFGSDGGGEAYGFDTRRRPWRVVRVPFVGMEWKLAERMGGSFSGFLQKLRRTK